MVLDPNGDLSDHAAAAVKVIEEAISRSKAEASADVREVDRTLKQRETVQTEEDLRARGCGCFSGLGAMLGFAGRSAGVPAFKKQAASKLDSAVQSLEKHVEALDAKALEQRARARQLQKSGQLKLAKQSLARALHVEASAAKQRDILYSLERHADTVEATAVQQQVAAALASTKSKSKRGKKMLSGAEDAVDAAEDLKDLSNDLNEVMGSLGATNTIDDDELEVELASMLAEEKPLTDPKDDETAIAIEIETAAARLAVKHDDSAEARVARRAFPSAPRRTKVEREPLMAEVTPS